MGKIRLVVFDMAGTTVFDRGNVADAFQQAFRANGLEVGKEKIKTVMGWRKKDAIKKLLEQFYPEHANAINIETIHTDFINTMIRFYETDPELRAQPFTEEIFAQLRQQGIKIALNTGFTRSITDTILKRLGWVEGKQVDVVIASDEVENGRPHSDMIRNIMKKLDIHDPEQVVKIGDTEVDIEEGRNAGCGIVIGVTTGAYSREQLKLYHPDHIIDSLADLSRIIQQQELVNSNN